MHRSGQSDWAHLPGDIGRCIRFKQLQQRLHTALHARPKAKLYLRLSEVGVTLGKDTEGVGDCFTFEKRQLLLVR